MAKSRQQANKQGKTVIQNIVKDLREQPKSTSAEDFIKDQRKQYEDKLSKEKQDADMK